MNLQLTAGVTAARGQTNNAQELAWRAAELAEKAAQAGTFGVGGVLIDRSGRLHAEAVNAVIRDGAVHDPTAHVERQLIDWYFGQSRNSLPPPEEMVIVTSLDPCAMCAGAILQSGFAAVAIADDPLSGVHQNGCPHRMPRSLWAKAEVKLKLVAGRERPAQWTQDLGPASYWQISEEVVRRCEEAFKRSLKEVRSIVGSGIVDEPGAVSWQGVWDLPLGASIADAGLPPVKKASREQLLSLLDGDRSCLIYNDGRPILLAESAKAQSPTRSSMLELIRAYTAMRLQARQTGRSALPHPRQCSVLQRRPAPSAEQDLLDLGALGSFLEAKRSPGPFPLLVYLEDDDPLRAQENVASLPPLYRETIAMTVGALNNVEDRTIDGRLRMRR